MCNGTVVQALPEEWSAHIDPQGRTFYANTSTGESSWTKPEALLLPEASLLPENWSEATDDYGRTYYTNASTGESTWTRPEKSSLPEGWTALQDGEGRTYYTNVATGESSWTLPDSSPLPEGWAANQDAEGRTYYSNMLTGESSWERPSSTGTLSALASIAPPAVSKEFGRRHDTDDETEKKGTLASRLDEWLMCAGFFKQINSFVEKNVHKFADPSTDGSGHSLESYAAFQEYEAMVGLRCEAFLLLEGATAEEAVDSMLLEEEEPGQKFKVSEYLMASIDFETFVSLMLDFKSGEKDLSRWQELFQEWNDWTWVPAE